jgi:pyrophosphatase PpaX
MATLRWRTVLFDLDGTLVDTIGLIVASHRHAITTVLGRDLPDEVLRGGIGRPLLEQMRVFDPERAQQLFEAYRVWNHANTERLLRRYPGVDEVLVALHAAGARVGVVTSKMRDAVDLAFRILPPPIRFDAIVTAEDTERHKPGPEPILHALDVLDASPDGAVYVGDARYDVEAARAAGTAAIAVTWGAGDRASLEAARPDAIVDTPGELAAVLGVQEAAA